jgi:hypothetical protein
MLERLGERIGVGAGSAPSVPSPEVEEEPEAAVEVTLKEMVDEYQR